MAGYSPKSFRGLTWHDALPAMRDRADTPSAYLDRCLATIAAREPVVQAFAALNQDSARAAAEASTRRWAAGAPLSRIDGMPIGIKDLLETVDMPTQMNAAGYKGNFPKRDNAAVRALREAGAVILGKTVTAELGGSHPGPTTNPFDPTRTPGGSSSGSAAAVAAGFMPAAIGTQVGGSIIRPASYCGNLALKPSQGGINRGERQATSQSTHGPHANSFEDLWAVAMEIVTRVGGDRGHAGLMGPAETPAPVKPQRVIVMEGAGWKVLDAASLRAFDLLLDRLRAAGIAVLRRGDHRLLEHFEDGIAEAGPISNGITAWENQWGHRNLINQDPEAISPRLRQTLAGAEKMTPSDYAIRLLQREEGQRRHAAIAPLADAMISFASPGPAPVWAGDVPGQPLVARPTGDAVFNTPSSMLFAPVVTVPLMAVGGMPVGLQVMGQREEDARMVGIARWLHQNIEAVEV